MTVILEQYLLPEEPGTIEIYQLVTVHVTAKEAQRMVRRWLSDEVAFLVTSAEPILVVMDEQSVERSVWRVPAIYSTPHIGPVGEVGSVDVDIESGEMFVNETLKQAILQEVEALAETLPPFEPRELDEIATNYLVQNYQPTDDAQLKQSLQMIIDAQEERMIKA